jgi:hypothetical protein
MSMAPIPVVPLHVMVLLHYARGVQIRREVPWPFAEFIQNAKGPAPWTERQQTDEFAKALDLAVRSSRVSRARYTSPIPPAPIAAKISYGPKRIPGDSAILSRFYAEKKLVSGERHRLLSEIRRGPIRDCGWITGNSDVTRLGVADDTGAN